MKKIISFVLVAIVILALVAMTACTKSEPIKVYEDYELTSEGYAFCVTKGHTDLLNQANQMLSDLEQNGELDKIINSFFDGTSDFVYENPVSTVPTDKSKYLVVATNATFPPFEYVQGNKFTGIDIQLASILAERMNKILFVYDMDFDSVVVSIQEGDEANIGMAGLTVTEDRKQKVDFTTQYYQSAQVLITLASDTTFDGCKSAEDIIAKLKEQPKSYTIGTQSGTTGYMFSMGNEGFEYEGFTNLTTKGYPSGALAVQDLANGRINAVIIDKQPAIMMAESMNKRAK